MCEESLRRGRAGKVMRAISILDTVLRDLNTRTHRLSCRFTSI
jgi:hypothetical protein